MNLPLDIITNILSHLPVKSLLRFKSVSKSWYSLINDQKFIKSHLNRAIEGNNINIMIRHSYLSTIDYDSSFDIAKDIDYPFKTSIYGVEILGSCNGLVCISPDEDVYCVWNPCTKEYRKIPDTPIDFPPGQFLSFVRTMCHGFGYDETRGEYKLVRIANIDDDGSDVKVYSVGRNSWKKVQDVPYYILYKRQLGVFVNGCLHWAATRGYESDSKVIASFDLVEEVFKEVALPDFEDDDEFHMNVDVLGGSLCLLRNVYPVRVEGWVMKTYGVKDSWTKLFCISQQTIVGSFEYLLPLCYFRSDSRLLMLKDGKELRVYDLVSGKAKTLQIRGIPDWFEAETYIGSLVSLNSGTYVGQKQAQGRRRRREQRSNNVSFGLL
ncbi:hypothetical protein ACHQM5_010357 [Ranunculus cassubicifolius]